MNLRRAHEKGNPDHDMASGLGIEFCVDGWCGSRSKDRLGGLCNASSDECLHLGC